jgi:hypothetical protein
VSGDGRTVLHEATKSGSYTTVKAYDPVTTTDEEVAVTSAEVSPPTGHSWVAGLSATGGRVLLASFAALAPGAPGPSNLGWFLRDRDAGTTTLVPAPSDALTIELTRDGNAVVWTSYVAPSQALPYGASVITRYRLSDGATTARQLDGLYPMFTIDGDGSLAVYRVVENGGYNLYRLDIDTGVTTPIGGAGVGIDGIAQPNAAGTTITLWSRSRLRTIDLDGNVLDVIDRAWNGRAPDSGSSPPVMSADGRTVAFASEATNLFATPSSGYFVYVHTRA